MFKLERVEIQGFKSFYEKADLAFPGSVTAVVGPNGCGKSNICDAVAWALGEQSAKVLRGERMDDVIFNGSAKRRPLGMAEVILTLSRLPGGNGHDGNGNGQGDGEIEESAAEEGALLRIGRRVYREGHGEYYLNDKQVRLKDIQDQLLGTGLGVRLYSVIEQGRIDQVLSTKPQDRRRLIEEAAGITKYKLRKRLAETKLEETRGNLLRLSDILSEIERNVASLKRQASRAARYKEKSQELRRVKAALARVEHDRLSASLGEAERESGARRDRETQASARLARAEAELATKRLAGSEAVGERDRLRQLVSSLEGAIQRDDALLESNRRAAADLAHRLEALEREGREVSSETERSARELADFRERLDRAMAEARSRSLAREEADRKATAATAALAALERDLEAARTESLKASADRVAIRNARHDVDLEVSRVAASLARLEEARQKLDREISEKQAEVRRAQEEADLVRPQARDALTTIEKADAELALLSSSTAEAEAAREQARQALGSVEHRHEALSEILRSREGTVQSVRDAFARAGVSQHGCLSDRLVPSPGWEEAIDLLLGEDLDALLAAGDVSAAVEAARGFSPTSFVQTDWDKTASPSEDSLRSLLSRSQGEIPEGGWDIALSNFETLSPAERAALPPAIFVDSLADALALSARLPQVAVVTRSRELVRGSLIRLFRAAPETGGPFALKRELDTLVRRIGQERDSVAAFERSIEDLRRARADLEAGLPELREQERQANARLSAIMARTEERRAEQDRFIRERETLALESSALAQESERLSARRAELAQEETRQAAREAEAHRRADALAATLPEARSFASAAAEDLGHRRTEAEVAAERRRSLEAARDRLQETAETLQRRVTESAEEGRRLSQRSQELASEERETRERQRENLRAREERASELEAASSIAIEATLLAERAEEEARTSRSVLDVAREERFAAEMAETKVRSDLEHLIAQARDEFGVSPGELPSAADESPEALVGLQAEAAELAEAIERLGPVNVLAFEEHEEMSKRLTFLSAQRDDLLRSIAELQESIRKINTISSQRFREAFAAVNENFKAMFARLFQGGTAEMRLLDETDLLESGVEIIAQPPGKRNQSILLLSGGEKALTAIALLMAIFRYKPSPFCILDEVDAPLDEANIDRFTRLLRDMTEETQFIAITHNKRTMETADALYGVTMEEPGISKIVSVRFD